MRAAVLHEVGAPLVIHEDLAPAPLGDRQVRLRVEGSGVCHSDLSVLNGSVPMLLPLILGHEAAGVVVDVGCDVTSVRPGDRVISSFAPVCGVCWYCIRDQTNLCESIPPAEWSRTVRATAGGEGFTAMAGLGAFADEMTAEETMVVKVRTDLTSSQLALIGCAVATGVGAALNTARVQPGSAVAVLGCGGVGQAVIQGARIAGAARVLAVDPVAYKREMALSLGATGCVDPSEGSVVEQIKAATDGRGVDYSFEVTGRPDVILDAFHAARRGGTVVVVGMHPAGSSVTLPAGELFRAEKKILGCHYGSSQVRRDFPRLIALAEGGRLDLGAMVTKEIDLVDVNDAFRAMEAGEVIRSVIVSKG
jgi:S-(hydroxymethyl)glutathione dehydrogenase/alcohol dehydrogenase